MASRRRSGRSRRSPPTARLRASRGSGPTSRTSWRSAPTSISWSPPARRAGCAPRSATTAPARSRSICASTAAARSVAAPVAAEPVPAAPVERDLDDLAGAAGALAAPDGAGAAAAALYPSLSAALGADRVAAIALGLGRRRRWWRRACSSIFSGLVIDLGPGDGPPRLGWAVTRTDPRFRLVELEIAGPGVAGSLRTFLRQPPVAPPGFADAARRVPAGAFAGRHALGDRRLAGPRRRRRPAARRRRRRGDADLAPRPRRGRSRRRRIAAAGGAAAVMPYDAPPRPRRSSTGCRRSATCSTSPPARSPARPAPASGPSGWPAFLAIYAIGFADAVAALLARQPGTALRALYPSSAYVRRGPPA